VTSSIKPEVHNVSQRRQRRTSHSHWVSALKFCEDCSIVSNDMLATDTLRQMHRHTDRQTDRNSPLPTGAG